MTKAALSLNEATFVAERIRQTLLYEADAFSKVDVAGSIRRRKPTVGDIELVAEIDPDKEFGATSRIREVLARTGVRRADPTIRSDGLEVRAPWGDRYMRGLYTCEGVAPVQVDLFIVRPPAEWGVVYLIRTGSAAFSQAVVTRLHNYGLKSDEGRIIVRSRAIARDFGEDIPCPDEETFFKLAGLPFVPPERRDMDIPETAALFREAQP